MNKYRPHVLVLPEDDANRQIANGFLLEPAIQARCVQILPSAGGWLQARDKLIKLLPEMTNYPERVMVLLVDFDDKPRRGEEIKAAIPDALHDRVYVLGVRSEPENLRSTLGSYEQIGQILAGECVNDGSHAWDHPLLAHNADEATRLLTRVRPFLLP
jgi:hypothetical protein